MLASVRSLLNQIIDYAGLFPPAKLPLEDALRNYLRYKKESPYAWMLGRFVCPSAKLQELLTLAKAHPDGALLSLTVLGTQSPKASEVERQVEADVHAIAEFRRTWGNDAVIEVYEVALPKGTAAGQLGDCLHSIVRHIQPARLLAFLEIPLSPTWLNEVDKLAHEISKLQRKWPSKPVTVPGVFENRAAVEKWAEENTDHDRPRIGLKLRCGGVTAEAFPSDDHVAHFIMRCRADEVPWKATAGLHHPRRHWDANLQLWHQGFLNVFGAHFLAYCNPLSKADLVTILADRDALDFRFDEAGFAWKSWTCPIDSIADYNGGSSAFGSCSFDEPIEDLIAMGLLDRT